MKIPKPGMFVKNKDIVDSDFGPLNIDREKVNRFASKHRGSVRLASGRYYTCQDFEERKSEVLKKHLP